MQKQALLRKSAYRLIPQPRHEGLRIVDPGRAGTIGGEEAGSGALQEAHVDGKGEPQSHADAPQRPAAPPPAPSASESGEEEGENP